MVEVPYTWRPTGWFQIGWSRDVAVGQAVPLRYFGEDLVAYRGEGGGLHVMRRTARTSAPARPRGEGRGRLRPLPVPRMGVAADGRSATSPTTTPWRPSSRPGRHAGAVDRHRRGVAEHGRRAPHRRDQPDRHRPAASGPSSRSCPGFCRGGLRVDGGAQHPGRPGGRCDPRRPGLPGVAGRARGARPARPLRAGLRGVEARCRPSGRASRRDLGRGGGSARVAVARHHRHADGPARGGQRAGDGRHGRAAACSAGRGGRRRSRPSPCSWPPDAASFVTGTDVLVDGGAIARSAPSSRKERTSREGPVVGPRRRRRPDE